MAVPTTFYLAGLQNYVQRHLKSKAVFFEPSRPVMTLDQPGGELELDRVTLDLAEALMIGEGVALGVTGENVHLAYVTRMFGVHDASELIRRGIVEFVGEADQPGFSVDPSAIRHTDGSPVQPGNPLMVTFKWADREPNVYGPKGLDPEAAAAAALRRFAGELELKPRDIGELSRRTAKHTHIVPLDRVSNITTRVSSAYAAGQLECIGLSPQIARDTNVFQDKALYEVIARVSYVENLLDFELDQYQMPTQWDDIMRFTQEASSVDGALRSVDRIMELRRAADLRSLFRDRVLRIEDIPTLRMHPATRGFRRWLWSKPDPRDADVVVEEFLRDITNVDQGTVRRYMTRVAKVAAITFVQDQALDTLQLPAGVRMGVDVALGVGQLLAGTALDKFKVRPPSGFFDQVIEPALHDASNQQRQTGQGFRNEL